jgi:hypothetical protein
LQYPEKSLEKFQKPISSRQLTAVIKIVDPR